MTIILLCILWGSLARGRFAYAQEITPYKNDYLAIRSFIEDHHPEVSSTNAHIISSELIIQSKIHELDPKLIAALIDLESGFDHNAKSRSGAKGLGQLMKSTYRLFNVKNPFDIKENISATFQYVKQLWKMWEGSPSQTTYTLAAYLRGDQAIKRSKGELSPKTESYIQRIMNRYHKICKTQSTSENLEQKVQQP